MTDTPDEPAGSATSTDESPPVKDPSKWTLQTQAAFEPADTSDLVVTIVSAVADVEDVPVDRVDPPLQEVVDVDAISRSFARTHATDRDRDFSLEFPYRDHRIVVRGDEWVQVYSKQE
ncbi:HalOD1 output domain-containing protein [Halobacterium zhouii]|uniref:HalOD1 output domain-containing protein n=1 Tax=Halobacterium zhouii TaxID=2902624 RepID=UPI001E57F0C6|nr:HalOD1 output domain-containing protein [Halobacterium zhouii]